MITGPSLSCAASAAAARRPQPAPAATGNHELDHDPGAGQGARPVTTTQVSLMTVGRLGRDRWADEESAPEGGLAHGATDLLWKSGPCRGPERGARS